MNNSAPKELCAERTVRQKKTSHRCRLGRLGRAPRGPLESAGKLFEIRPYHVDELFGGAGGSVGLGCGIDQMHADVIFDHFAHQTVDCAAGGRDELQDVATADFLVHARSTASTCPRIRRTRFRSLVFSRTVWDTRVTPFGVQCSRSASRATTKFSAALCLLREFPCIRKSLGGPAGGAGERSGGAWHRVVECRYSAPGRCPDDNVGIKRASAIRRSAGLSPMPVSAPCYSNGLNSGYNFGGSTSSRFHHPPPSAWNSATVSE